MRSWTIEDRGPRPFTTNGERKLVPHSRARVVAEIRDRWTWLARAHHLPGLPGMTVTVQPMHRDQRSPQDVAACAPHAKAVIDGLVDAGVLPDDGPRWLHAVTFLPPDVCGHDGIRVTVTEVAS